MSKNILFNHVEMATKWIRDGFPCPNPIPFIQIIFIIISLKKLNRTRQVYEFPIPTSSRPIKLLFEFF